MSLIVTLKNTSIQSFGTQGGILEFGGGVAYQKHKPLSAPTISSIDFHDHDSRGEDIQMVMNYHYKKTSPM